MSDMASGGDGIIWDVLIVGAGPAGSNAAASAASAGATTLLVDAATFPRYKTCGGGLIGVSASLVNDMPDLPLKDVITRVSFSLRGTRFHLRESPSAVMEMVSRDEFDDFLVRRAIHNGAKFEPGTRVREITEGDDYVTLRTDNGFLRARAVVGADGSSSKIAQYVGVTYAISDLGLEAEIDGTTQGDRWKGRVHLDWGPIPGSYGWLFPKGDVLTAGIITKKGDPDAARRYYNDFLKYLGIDGLPRIRESGHFTRCRSEDSPLSRGRALVAGDAAGLLEPWTREGISYAIRSGVEAGARAAELAMGRSDADVRAATSGYAQDLARTLLLEMSAGIECRTAFERSPSAFHHMIGRTGPGWRYFVRICNGDTNFHRAMRHLSTRLVVRVLKSRPEPHPKPCGYLTGVMEL